MADCKKAGRNKAKSSAKAYNVGNRADVNKSKHAKATLEFKARKGSELIVRGMARHARRTMWQASAPRSAEGVIMPFAEWEALGKPRKVIRNANVTSLASLKELVAA